MDRSETLPKIASRRVTQVPPELEQTLEFSSYQTCPVCETEVAWPYLPVECEDCDLPLYCSEECRRQGWTNHKSDGCGQMATTLQKVYSAHDKLRSDMPSVRQWYRNQFPGEFDGGNFVELMGNRFTEDPFMKPFLDCRAAHSVMLACHPSLALAVERGLCGLVRLRMKTCLADPYNSDVWIVSVLLKLYREDDAVAFILYWLDWRSRGGGGDDEILYVEPEFWPYPIIENARLLDISHRLCSFPEQEVGASVPLEFALTVLVIKMRFITVYISRAQAAALYLRASSGGHQPLTDDMKSHVISFLVAGGRERYLLQRNHANILMGYIDKRDATLLPALVDPRIIRRENEVCFERFLKEYANGKPVVRTIKCTLMGRYFDRKVTSETGKRAASDGVSAENNVRPQKLPRQDEA